MPAVHHVQLCVADGPATVQRLRRYGFRLCARRDLPGRCSQYVARLGAIFFLVTERDRATGPGGPVVQEPFAAVCCGDSGDHEVDTVFNVALSVKNVEKLTDRIEATYAGSVIERPATVEDERGRITYSVVKSPCGNVIHTLMDTSGYAGGFLPGFQPTGVGEEDIGRCADVDALNATISHIDHVTLATNNGDSMRLIEFYQACFGMKKFSISSNDDADEGLILDEGVGLRLRAMEYYKCAETGLLYRPCDDDCADTTSSDDHAVDSNSTDKGVLFVVVESLPGQQNCNVEAYLRAHRQPGVEHIAFRTSNIYESVRAMKHLSVHFRSPPAAYYEHLKKEKNLAEIGENFEQLAKLGILLDNEVEPDSPAGTQNYLMQIFAHPLFSPSKTFFIEIIQRYGARGLGAGNIIALVKSIREEEKRKAREAEGKKSTEESRSVC